MPFYTPEILATNVHNFGAYFYNPTTLKVLSDVDYLFHDIDTHGSSLVYPVGFTLVKYFNRAMYDYVYKPLDYLSNNKDEKFSGVVTLILVYTSPKYDDSAISTVESATTKMSEVLSKQVGIRRYVHKDSPMDDIYKAMVFPTKMEIPTNKVEPCSKVSRDASLEVVNHFIGCLRDTPDIFNGLPNNDLLNIKELLSALESLVKSYESITKQHKVCKNVRMADGSRKWVSNDKADELLKLPVKDRH